MEVLDRGGEIVFLRKLKEGPAAESYGLHVARLAGLSDGVLKRAAEIMERLKEGEKILHQGLPGPLNLPPETVEVPAVPNDAPVKASDRVRRIADDIATLDLNHMTPLEALNRIHAWKALFDGNRLPEGRETPKSSGKPHRDSPGPTLFDE
jgi:DNA mismatch repair protein MutS